MGVKQNGNKQPANVVNLSKSVSLHANVMQRIVTIPCQIVVDDIDRNLYVIMSI